VDSSFERFCLTAGIGAIEQMLCEDAQQLAGTPHNRGGGRVGHRQGRLIGRMEGLVLGLNYARSVAAHSQRQARAMNRQRP
jgi:hypothetical protein